MLFEPTTTRTAALEEIEDQCGSVVRHYPDIGVAVAGSADEAFGTRLGPHPGLQRRTRAHRCR